MGKANFHFTLTVHASVQAYVPIHIHAGRVGAEGQKSGRGTDSLSRKHDS
jgi:hypothetical protein